MSQYLKVLSISKQAVQLESVGNSAWQNPHQTATARLALPQAEQFFFGNDIVKEEDDDEEEDLPSEYAASLYSEKCP